MTNKLVIVYGSLRVGEYNYASFELEQARTVAQNDTVSGYIMRAGPWYPAIFEGPPDATVQVDVLDLSTMPQSDFILENIHRMEEGAGYLKHIVRTDQGHEGWLYYMEADRAMMFPHSVSSGNWLEYAAEDTA